MKRPMTDKEFSLFFTPIVSSAHLHGIDSQEAILGVKGLVKSIKASGPETKQWFLQGIKAKITQIQNKSTDFHVDMKMVLDRILDGLI